MLKLRWRHLVLAAGCRLVALPSPIPYLHLPHHHNHNSCWSPASTETWSSHRYRQRRAAAKLPSVAFTSASWARMIAFSEADILHTGPLHDLTSRGPSAPNQSDEKRNTGAIKHLTTCKLYSKKITDNTTNEHLRNDLHRAKARTVTTLLSKPCTHYAIQYSIKWLRIIWINKSGASTVITLNKCKKPIIKNNYDFTNWKGWSYALEPKLLTNLNEYVTSAMNLLQRSCKFSPEKKSATDRFAATACSINPSTIPHQTIYCWETRAARLSAPQEQVIVNK